jgi:hypothetical protein
MLQQASDEIRKKGGNAMTITKMMLIIAAIFTFVAGCSGEQVRDGIYRGMYEGSRIENRGKMTPAERATKFDPEYDRYSGDRQKQMESDPRQ